MFTTFNFLFYKMTLKMKLNENIKIRIQLENVFIYLFFTKSLFGKNRFIH